MKHSFSSSLLVAGALSLLASGAALAVVPGSVEPSRAPKQLSPIQEAPKTEGAGTVSARAALSAPAGAENVKLKLAHIEIEGMTAYAEADVSSLWRDRLGQTITLADVYGIANQLTAKYRNEGYILTQVVVPPQTIDGGKIKYRVVEGVVDNVRIEGNTNGSLDTLQPYMNKIRAARPFNSKTMERYLLLINDLPGISAKAVLSPSKTVGATDIVIVVERKPYDIFLQADNRGSRFLGPFQLNSSVRFNNPFGNYEGINLQYATAPFGGELNYGNISYIQPVGSEGTKLTVGARLSRTLPGFSLSALDVRGLAQSVDLEAMHPFIRSRNENLSATLRFNYLDSTRKDNTGGHRTTDRISALRLGTLFQIVDSFTGINSFAAEISKGIKLFNAASGADPNTSRPGADGTFFKGTAEISRLQRLMQHLDLFISGTAQWSNDRLLASEQFGVGGISYGSAYDNSEITGDQGIAMRTELRWNEPLKTNLKSVQLYGFHDVGKVYDPGNTVPDDRIRSVASAGAGLRVSFDKTFSGSFEYAAPLTRRVQTSHDAKPRLFGTLTARF